MKNFIDRKQELKILNETFDNKDSLILINGSHHVGKTQLIKEFIKDKPAFYFSASEVTDELNRKKLQDLIQKSFPNAPKNNYIASWDELLGFLASQAKDKTILVLDNLDNIIQTNPNFVQNLDKIWNNILKPKHFTTILSMPNNSVLANFNKNNSNLKKEINLRLQLKPIPFFELVHYYPNKPIYELISIYNITGGFPLYWDYFVESKSMIDQIQLVMDLMTEPSGYFYDLPLSLIQKNVWDTPNYISILYYLAHDINTFKELLQVTHLKKNQLLKYLSNLEILGYVKVQKPLLKRRSSYRDYHYILANPLFKFWFRFIYPNRSNLNKEETKAEILENYPSFIENTFSQIAEEMFLASTDQNLIDFKPNYYGLFWNKDLEIPFLAIDDKNKKLFIADTQFALKDYDLEQFIDFTKKTLNIKDFKKYNDYQRIYGLFTANTPSEDLMRYALNNDDVVIFAGTKLIKK